MVDGMNVYRLRMDCNIYLNYGNPSLLRLPDSAMIPICQGADVVFQKSVHASMNLPLNYSVAHPA